MGKKLLIIIFVTGLTVFSLAEDIKGTFPQIEDIHAGAVFVSNTGSMRLVLVKTYDGKFLFSNSWDGLYDLFSTFAPYGGTAKQVCSHLRGGGWLYTGKAKSKIDDVHSLKKLESDKGK